MKDKLWLKDNLPNLPFFRNTVKVKLIVNEIKVLIYKYIIEGLSKYFKNSEIFDKKDSKLWYIACVLSNYGNIYFVNRHEIFWIREIIKHNLSKFLLIQNFVSKKNLSTKVMNYSVFSILLEWEEKNIIYFPNFYLPKNSFFSKSKQEIFVNKTDIKQYTKNTILDVNEQLYDLHDFSHYCCVCLDSSLYGTRNFDGLDKLNFKLKDLILSSDFLNPNSYYYSDNILYRQLSLFLFDELYNQNLEENKITKLVSDGLFEYFKGKNRLTHPFTNYPCKSNKPLTLNELIVLSQNKCYEYPASEFEEQLFIRSGNDEKCQLFKSNNMLEAIFSDSIFHLKYFELRNFVRHRSIRNAYIKYANFLKIKESNPRRHETLNLIINFLQFNKNTVEEHKNLYLRC